MFMMILLVCGRIIGSNIGFSVDDWRDKEQKDKNNDTSVYYE